MRETWRQLSLVFHVVRLCVTQARGAEPHKKFHRFGTEEFPKRRARVASPAAIADLAPAIGQSWFSMWKKQVSGRYRDPDER